MELEFGAAGPCPLLTGISCAAAPEYPEHSTGSNIPGKAEDVLAPAVLGWDFWVIFNSLFSCYSDSA